jgi:mediator of RNA polymerase II transcription subunit 14
MRSDDSQPEAGPSKPNVGGNRSSHANPQLSSEPWFAYPTPPPDILDGELPPYMESENLPMGLLLDRLSRKAHGDLRTLVTET